MILAGVCIVVAACFLLRGDFDAAFVIAALGLVSWFLNYRTQVRESLAAGRPSTSNDEEGRRNSDEN